MGPMVPPERARSGAGGIYVISAAGTNHTAGGRRRKRFMVRKALGAAARIGAAGSGAGHGRGRLAPPRVSGRLEAPAARRRPAAPP